MISEGDLLRSDPRFAPFLESNFNAAEFASRAIASDKHSTAQAQLDRLQEGIERLDNQLRTEVLRNQDDLISQSSELGEVDSSLQRITLSVRSLQSVAARVRAEVLEPYQQVAAKTQQLRSLQRTVDLLRHVIHRLKLMQRLRMQMAAEGGGRWAGGWTPPEGMFLQHASIWVRRGPAHQPTKTFLFHSSVVPRPTRIYITHAFTHAHNAHVRVHVPAHTHAGILEAAKAAKLLSDIAAVDAEADLGGIDVVESDAGFLQTALAQVRSQTEAAFKAGLDSLSQADVGSALQVRRELGRGCVGSWGGDPWGCVIVCITIKRVKYRTQKAMLTGRGS
jgi:hypothetical protein